MKEIEEVRMEHTVRKSRRNRIAMRFTASVFILIAVLRILYVIFSSRQTNMLITIILCAGCLTYGITLLQQTLKPQAYDITYVFKDKTLLLKMHHGEKEIHYKEIRDLGYVVPNEKMDYGIVQIYIGKEQFVIPFMGNSNVGEALYQMLKMKKEEK